ncbi:WcaI family glycosyltransferase [Fibrella sp. USSR17]
MKILIYTTNYWPELTGSGKYNGELAEWFSKQGHSIDIITAYPHYPQWRIEPFYKKKWWSTQLHAGVKIYRSPIFVPNPPTGKGRILSEISFALTSSIYWVRVFFQKYDVIIATCPPLQVGLYPYLYSLLKKVPFLFHIQDLQVDVAKKLQMIQNPLLLKLLVKLENFLLTNATYVSSISEGMKQNILNKGVNEKNYFMLPNWVDTEFIKPLSPDQSMRSALQYNSTDYVVLYSGNMGEKQGLEFLIGAAELLSSETSIKFLVCGDGVFKTRLEEQVIHKKLTNVNFLPLQPYDELPSLFATADLHLIIQKKAASDIVMPSKLTTILSSGGAVLATAEDHTSLAQVIVKNKLGWSVIPEDALALASQILLAKSDTRVQEYKLNARRYACQHLGKEAVLHQFERQLISITQK